MTKERQKKSATASKGDYHRVARYVTSTPAKGRRRANITVPNEGKSIATKDRGPVNRIIATHWRGYLSRQAEYFGNFAVYLDDIEAAAAARFSQSEFNDLNNQMAKAALLNPKQRERRDLLNAVRNVKRLCKVIREKLRANDWHAALLLSVDLGELLVFAGLREYPDAAIGAKVRTSGQGVTGISPTEKDRLLEAAGRLWKQDPKLSAIVVAQKLEREPWVSVGMEKIRKIVASINPNRKKVSRL